MSQADPQVTLARLRETIAQLQGIVATLETEARAIPQAALDSVVADTAALVQQLQAPNDSAASPEVAATPPASTEDEWDEDLFTETPPPQSVAEKKPARSKTPLQRRPRQPWWQQQKVIIGAIAATAAFILVWQFTTTTDSEDVVATQPTDSIETIETVETAPTPEIDDGRSPEIVEQPSPEVDAKPTPPVEVKPAPPLTPEQRLIAAIQTQLEDVSQPYGDNIVRSIQPDFAASTLKITVGDAWYLLKEGLQDRLGADVLELAQMLDFKTMRVEDLEGNFVARNPVVGDALVIMRRYQTYGDE